MHQSTTELKQTGKSMMVGPKNTRLWWKKKAKKFRQIKTFLRPQPFRLIKEYHISRNFNFHLSNQISSWFHNDLMSVQSWLTLIRHKGLLIFCVCVCVFLCVRAYICTYVHVTCAHSHILSLSHTHTLTHTNTQTHTHSTITFNTQTNEHVQE